MGSENRSKRIELLCRLSVSELARHKRICAGAGIKSQEYLHLNLMNYEPYTDCRCEMIDRLMPVLDNCNRIARLIKHWVESSLLEAPPVDVRSWTTRTAEIYLTQLNAAMQPLPQMLEEIRRSDPRRKLVREEIREEDGENLTKTLHVRVLPWERDYIRANAERCMLTVSAYIRYIATGKHPQSREILTAAKTIAKVSGDMGRIKGVMHYWLSKDEKLQGMTIAGRRQLIENARTAIKNQIQASMILKQITESTS